MAETAPQTRDIGVDVPAPERSCQSDRCPWNGRLKVRGSQIVGNVVSVKMQHTVIVKKERSHFVPKYQRYERRSGRYPAHVPSCLDVAVGDEVLIMECRPLSKTVGYVVVERRPSQ